MNVNLAKALYYAKRGFPVFPLHTPVAGGGCSCRKKECTDVGKHPRTKNGFKDASTDPEVITRWWKMWPDANIGISTGPANLVVLDVDPKNGGMESHDALKLQYPGFATEAPTTITGGSGLHIFYRQPEGQRVKSSSGILGPGLDVRADGGYVVAASSLHASGYEYAWDEGLGLDDIELPVWPGPVSKPSSLSTLPPGEVAMVPEGSRNQWLTHMAGILRHRGSSERAIFAFLLVENEERLVPPLDEESVRKVAWSVGRYEPGKVHLLIDSDAELKFERLVKIDTDPPSYILTINGQEVRLSSGSLFAHDQFRAAMLEQLNLYLAPVKKTEWSEMVSALVNDMEVVAVPDDADLSGLIWAAVRENLAKRHADTSKYNEGEAITHDGFCIVQGWVLFKAVRLHGLHVEQTHIWRVCQEHGATKITRMIDGQRVSGWAIPVKELE